MVVYALKALFNDVFTFKKSELHITKCYQESLIRCPKALKKMHIKSTIKSILFISPHRLVFKKMVRLTIYSVVKFSHRYLESDI